VGWVSGGLQGNVNANKKAAQSPVRLGWGMWNSRLTGMKPIMHS
jgi:hypothetical protein